MVLAKCPNCGYEWRKSSGRWLTVLNTMYKNKIWDDKAEPERQGVIAGTVAEWMPGENVNGKRIWHILRRQEGYNMVDSAKIDGNRYFWLTEKGKGKLEYIRDQLKS